MSDFLGGLVSYVGNRVAQERSFEMQKELQNDAQNYNTLMWNKANEYNNPMQQMMRFQSAGLNPNLIYSQMNGGLAAPTIGAGSAPSPAQAPAMSLLESAQVGLVEAQKRDIEMDIADKQIEVDRKQFDLNQEKNWQDKERQLGLDLGHSNIALNDTQRELNESMKNLNEVETAKVNEEIPLIKNQVDLTFEQTRKAKIDADRANEFYDAQIRKLSSEANLNYTEAQDIVNTFRARVTLMTEQANKERWTQRELENQCKILGEQYVQSVYASKVAEANAAVEGSKGYQWTSKIVGLLSDAVGAVGGVMIGGAAIKGASTAAKSTAFKINRAAAKDMDKF